MFSSKPAITTYFPKYKKMISDLHGEGIVDPVQVFFHLFQDYMDTGFAPLGYNLRTHLGFLNNLFSPTYPQLLQHLDNYVIKAKVNPQGIFYSIWQAIFSVYGMPSPQYRNLSTLVKEMQSTLNEYNQSQLNQSPETEEYISNTLSKSLHQIKAAEQKKSPHPSSAQLRVNLEAIRCSDMLLDSYWKEIENDPTIFNAREEIIALIKNKLADTTSNFDAAIASVLAVLYKLDCSTELCTTVENKIIELLQQDRIMVNKTLLTLFSHSKASEQFKAKYGHVTNMRITTSLPSGKWVVKDIPSIALCLNYSLPHPDTNLSLATKALGLLLPAAAENPHFFNALLHALKTTTPESLQYDLITIILQILQNNLTFGPTISNFFETAELAVKVQHKLIYSFLNDPAGPSDLNLQILSKLNLANYPRPEAILKYILPKLPREKNALFILDKLTILAPQHQYTLVQQFRDRLKSNVYRDLLAELSHLFLKLNISNQIFLLTELEHMVRDSIVATEVRMLYVYLKRRFMQQNYTYAESLPRLVEREIELKHKILDKLFQHNHFHPITLALVKSFIGSEMIFNPQIYEYALWLGIKFKQSFFVKELFSITVHNVNWDKIFINTYGGITTFLLEAVDTNQPDIVKTLIARSANTDLLNPLADAVEINSVPSVTLLLNTATIGNTFHRACEIGYKPVLDAFFAAKIDVDRLDSKKETALFRLCKFRSHVPEFHVLNETVEWLALHNANLEKSAEYLFRDKEVNILLLKVLLSFASLELKNNLLTILINQKPHFATKEEFAIYLAKINLLIDSGAEILMLPLRILISSDSLTSAFCKKLVSPDAVKMFEKFKNDFLKDLLSFPMTLATNRLSAILNCFPKQLNERFNGETILHVVSTPELHMPNRNEIWKETIDLTQFLLSEQADLLLVDRDKNTTFKRLEKKLYSLSGIDAPAYLEKWQNCTHVHLQRQIFSQLVITIAVPFFAARNTQNFTLSTYIALPKDLLAMILAIAADSYFQKGKRKAFNTKLHTHIFGIFKSVNTIIEQKALAPAPKALSPQIAP